MISLKNTLKTYLAYVEFYLQKDTLKQYEKNMTNIYSSVEESLNNYILNQSEIIENIYESLSNYKSIYDEEIKSNLIEKINKIIKETSKKLLKKYLKNSNESISKNISNEKYTDLSNLGGLNTALGSTRLNYSTNIDNTIFKYGYNFIVDEYNYKVYLNLSANASANALINYQNEYISTNIAGLLGEGMIGLDLEIDFLNENVNALYKSEFNRTTVKKELHENTTISAWNNCSEILECIEGCPKSFIIENNIKKQVKIESKDLGNYVNSNVYEFISRSENNICSYSKYLYEVKDEIEEFNTSLKRTI